MAIRVDRANSMDGYCIHQSATKWVIDEHQQLHVVGPHGNAASYGRGAWASAYILTPKDLERENAILGADEPA